MCSRVRTATAHAPCCFMASSNPLKAIGGLSVIAVGLLNFDDELDLSRFRNVVLGLLIKLHLDAGRCLPRQERFTPLREPTDHPDDVDHTPECEEPVEEDLG